MHSAKSKLFKLVERLETGQENEVIIARNGMPVARLIAYSASHRIGAARHLLAGMNVPTTVEAFNAIDSAINADFEASVDAKIEL